MLPPLKRLDPYLGMEMVRRRDGHRVDVGLIEHLAIIIITAGNLEPLRRFLGALRILSRDRHCRRARTGVQAEQMADANCAGAYNATAESVSHMEFGLRRMFSANNLQKNPIF